MINVTVANLSCSRDTPTSLGGRFRIPAHATHLHPCRRNKYTFSWTWYINGSLFGGFSMALVSALSPQTDSQLTLIVEALYSRGYVVIEQVFDNNYLTSLLKQLIDLNPHAFQPAGIGRDSDYQKNQFIRSDRIHWLDGDETFLGSYRQWAEALRLAVNRRLFLGLYEYECMFAHYPKGAFYKRHIDAFQSGINRRLSTVLYLNPNWGPNDGGELVLYAPDSEQVLARVLPHMGTMVLFLSEEFPHEVLAANRARYSLTGWYRVNEGVLPAD